MQVQCAHSKVVNTKPLCMPSKTGKEDSQSESPLHTECIRNSVHKTLKYAQNHKHNTHTRTQPKSLPATSVYFHTAAAPLCLPVDQPAVRWRARNMVFSRQIRQTEDVFASFLFVLHFLSTSLKCTNNCVFLM